MGTMRKASVTDCTGITQCNKACLPMVYDTFEYFMFITSKNYEVIVIEHKGTIIGYLLGSYEFEDKNIHVMSIGVLDRYRKQGLGGQLLSFIGTIAGSKGCDTITLFVHVGNTVATTFYKKNGFIINELMKGYYEGCLTDVDSYDGYKMVKPITVPAKDTATGQN